MTSTHAGDGSEFFAEFYSDLDGDGPRPLQEYLARFPGSEEHILEEYLEFLRANNASDNRSDNPIRVGPYRIIEEIGAGSQGWVYKAADTRLTRVVALKVLPSRLPDADADLRFRREANAASRLDHPSICTIYDTGQSRGNHWIAMRLVRGDTLAQTITKARSPQQLGQVRKPPAGAPSASRAAPAPLRERELRLTLEVFETVARALQAAHDAGIIHRDLKPANIMLDQDGKPVVLDFGLARDQSHAFDLTPLGQRIGTPAYASPELVKGDRADRQSDVWALGVTLYEWLVLERPFLAPHELDLQNQICRHNPVDPRELNPAIGRDLSAVVLTALTKERNQRYASMAALADDLRAILERRPVSVRHPLVVTRAIRWCRREPVRAVMLAAALILVGLAGYIVPLFIQTWKGERERAQAQTYEQLVSNGLVRLANGDGEGAIQEFDSAIDFAPRRPAAWGAKAIVLQRAGRSARAMKELGDGPPSIRELAGLLQEDWVLEGTEKALPPSLQSRLGVNGLPTSESDAAISYFLIGLKLLSIAESGETPDRRVVSAAVGVLDQAVLLSTTDWLPTHMARCRALALSGARTQTAAAIRTLRQLWPNSLGAEFTAGLALSTIGDIEGAMKAYRRAAIAAPKRPESLNNLGRLLHQSGRKNEALHAYQEAVARQPMNGMLRYNLAKVLADVGRTREALEQYDLAIQHGDQSIVGLASLNSGSTLAKQKKWEASKPYLRRALSINPKSAIAKANLGLALAMCGDVAEGIKTCKAAIASQPQSGLVRLVFATLLQELGHTDAATKELKATINLNPRIAAAHFNLGNIYFDRDEHEDAERSFGRAIACEDRPEFHYNRGLARAKLGRIDAALESHSRALDLGYTNPSLYREVGLRLRDIGRFGDAIKHLDRAEKAGCSKDTKIPRNECVQLDRKLKRVKQLRTVDGNVPESQWVNGARFACRYRHFGVATDLWQRLFDAYPGRQSIYGAEAAKAAAQSLARARPSLPNVDARARLGRQAVTWLDAAFSTLQCDAQSEARQQRALRTLTSWLETRRLAAIRGPSQIERLPEGLRKRCSNLWSRVQNLADELQ